jgi:hypothetical protein
MPYRSLQMAPPVLSPNGRNPPTFLFCLLSRCSSSSGFGCLCKIQLLLNSEYTGPSLETSYEYDSFKVPTGVLLSMDMNISGYFSEQAHSPNMAAKPVPFVGCAFCA